MFYPLFKAFVDIALFKAGPQDLPASRFLLGFMLVCHCLVGVVLSLFSLPLGVAVLSALVGTLMVVALVQGVLTASRQNARFLQTATAMAGCETLLGLAALPITLWFYNSQDQTLPSFFSLGLVIWSLAIVAHIMRQALNTSLAMAMLLALGYMMASYYVVGLVIPGG